VVVGRGVRLCIVVVVEELRGGAVFPDVSPLQAARTLTIRAFINIQLCMIRSASQEHTFGYQ
jgi:hypothetical protein